MEEVDSMIRRGYKVSSDLDHFPNGKMWRANPPVGYMLNFKTY